MVQFLQCVWQSPTQHCTNKEHCNIYACTFNYNVTCQFLFALCGLVGFVNKHSWQWQRDIYVSLSFAERALLSGVSKKKTLLYSLSHASSYSCVKATSLIHFTADTFELQLSRLCQYFHMSLFSKVKHSGKFWIKAWRELLAAWGQQHNSRQLQLLQDFM